MAVKTPKLNLVHVPREYFLASKFDGANVGGITAITKAFPDLIRGIGALFSPQTRNRVSRISRAFSHIGSGIATIVNSIASTVILYRHSIPLHQEVTRHVFWSILDKIIAFSAIIISFFEMILTYLDFYKQRIFDFHHPLSFAQLLTYVGSNKRYSKTVMAVIHKKILFALKFNKKEKYFSDSNYEAIFSKYLAINARYVANPNEENLMLWKNAALKVMISSIKYYAFHIKDADQKLINSGAIKEKQILEYQFAKLKTLLSENLLHVIMINANHSLTTLQDVSNTDKEIEKWEAISSHLQIQHRKMYILYNITLIALSLTMLGALLFLTGSTGGIIPTILLVTGTVLSIIQWVIAKGWKEPGWQFKPVLVMHAISEPIIKIYHWLEKRLSSSQPAIEAK